MPVQIVKSAIAGVIAHVAVVEGECVSRDQAVMMIEIMKMEIAAESPADGRVQQLFKKARRHDRRGSAAVQSRDLTGEAR